MRRPRPSKGGDATRGLSITLPDPLKANTAFDASFEGQTGPQPKDTPKGFLVDAFVLFDVEECPLYEDADLLFSREGARVVSRGILPAGPIKGSAPTEEKIEKAGPARVCGYITTGEGLDKEAYGATIVDEPITVVPEA